jgi:hypothetical protein
MFKNTIVSTLAVLLMLSFVAGAQPQRGKAERVKSQQCVSPDASHTPGEIKRIVKGDESPVLHLGMVPSGATVIEFPASDHYFSVSTSDIGDWIRVEKSPTSRIDSHIVLRPGKDLEKSESAGIVQVQMRSGLVITLCIHPVKSSAQHTHRAVISYNRSEIIAAREKAGLATKLGEQESDPPAVTASASGPVTTIEALKRQPNLGPVETQAVATVKELERRASVAESGETRRQEADPAPSTEGDSKINEAVKKALMDVLKDPKSFKKWSSATNGLSVAARGFDLDGDTRIALVAIKNIEDAPLRILPGHPDLVIETVNENGKVIHLSPIKKQHEETTAKNNLISARGTVYYAIAFAPPILSTKQRMRITVGQRNAADAPAEAGLNIAGKIAGK